jgi:tetratricopeptide (TPR) repeat protein
MADALENARIAFTGKMACMTRREACLAVRAHGGDVAAYVSHQTTMLVVGIRGWPLLPDGQISRKLRRAEELRRAGCQICIAPEPAFLELIGRAPPAAASDKSFPASEVCRILGVADGILQRWEQFGLVRSREGCYDFQDLVSLQAIHGLVRNGVRPERIAASLRNLAAILPGMERPLAQLHIMAENPELLLVELGGVRFSDTGQLMLDFEGRRKRLGAVLPLDFAEYDVEEWFELGCGCEEEGMYPDASEAFQAVLALDPHSAKAYFHLGNIMREMGIPWAAEEFYGMAVKLDPGMIHAWTCLGGVQEEQGHSDAAIASYHNALAISPDYADGHFSLALCLEGVGRGLDARPHWFAFLKLDPASPSAPVARQRLSVTSRP